MKNLNLVMAFVLLAILICVIIRNNGETFQVNPQIALNDANLTYGLIPPGTIVSWCHDAELNLAGNRLQASTSANIPDGWVVCDGRSYTKSNGSTGYTPNLVGKFIYGGVGQNYANVSTQSGNTGEYYGGNANNFGNNGMYQHVTSTDPHTVMMNSGGKYKVDLTEAEMPRHWHGIPAKLEHHNPLAHYPELVAGHSHSRGTDYSFVGSNRTGGDTSLGCGNPGSPVSDCNGTPHENMPPYYTLVYIMKKY